MFDSWGMQELLHVELLPGGEVHIINDLRSKEWPTAMVGDGNE